MRIMYVTTVMVVIMIVWGMLDVDHAGRPNAAGTDPSNLSFSGAPENALGWLQTCLV